MKMGVLTPPSSWQNLSCLVHVQVAVLQHIQQRRGLIDTVLTVLTALTVRHREVNILEHDGLICHSALIEFAF